MHVIKYSVEGSLTISKFETFGIMSVYSHTYFNHQITIFERKIIVILTTRKFCSLSAWNVWGFQRSNAQETKIDQIKTTKESSFFRIEVLFFQKRHLFFIADSYSVKNISHRSQRGALIIVLICKSCMPLTKKLPK